MLFMISTPPPTFTPIVPDLRQLPEVTPPETFATTSEEPEEENGEAEDGTDEADIVEAEEPDEIEEIDDTTDDEELNIEEDAEYDEEE
jgi:hypothetical protein